MRIQNIFLPVFLILILAPTIIQAQSTLQNIQKGFSDKLSVDQYDAVILNEENELVFSGESSDFIYVSFSKKVRFKINTEAGIEQIASFVLPENLDPTYIAHYPTARLYTHVFSRMKCDYFNAEIIKENGEVKKAEIESDIKEIKMHLLREDYYGSYDKFLYRITNLEPGDELSIDYSYHLLYTENYRELSGFRIFFHSDIPKLKYSLTVQHHAELVVDYENLNNADPDTSSVIDKQIKYQWYRENLLGCINEPGSRPYKELPHITIKPRPYDLAYIVPHTNEERLTPLYTILAEIREKKHFSISVAVLQGAKTKQYLQIDKFIEKETKGIEDDSLGYEKIKRIHHRIVDDFEFKDDIDYYNRVDRRERRMGDHLSANQIRDLSRFDIYLALIRKLGLNYFTTYLCDNRSGNISDVFLAPMLYSDYLYTIMLNDEMVVFLYPKKSRFGYYLNEIPFYFEGSRGRLVHLNDYRHTEKAYNEDFREIFMPVGSAGANARTSRVMVDVSLQNKTAVFNSQVSLSGQFSTMTRGVYQYDYQDETVNKLYGRKIWDLNKDVQVLSKRVEVKKKEPPFTTVLTAKYQADNIVEIIGDTLILDLKNWFNHIIYKDFDITNRQMDFYPDFANRDTYSYYVRFDKDVSMLKGIENIQVNNELSTYILNIEQVDSKSIKIESHFAISDKVELDQIDKIKEIYDIIEELNDSRIKLLQSR